MAARGFGSISGGRLVDALAPGAYAWGITVAGPASQRFAPLGARICALVAVVSLVSGAILMTSSPAIARIAGIWGFLCASIGAWTFLGPSLLPSHLDPVQGVLGSLGWLLFAIAWAAPVTPPVDVPHPSTSLVDVGPRQAMTRTTPWVLAVVAAAAAVPMVLAWWVASTERALFAHAAALAAALALVACASDLFDPRGTAAEARALALRRPRERLREAASAVVVLLALVLIGATYALLR